MAVEIPKKLEKEVENWKKLFEGYKKAKKGPVIPPIKPLK